MEETCHPRLGGARPTGGRGFPEYHTNKRVILSNLYDKVVLLSLLRKNILAIDERLLTDLSIDVADFLLVDAYAVRLDHLAALSL